MTPCPRKQRVFRQHGSLYLPGESINPIFGVTGSQNQTLMGFQWGRILKCWVHRPSGAILSLDCRADIAMSWGLPRGSANNGAQECLNTTYDMHTYTMYNVKTFHGERERRERKREKGRIESSHAVEPRSSLVCNCLNSASVYVHMRVCAHIYIHTYYTWHAYIHVYMYISLYV